MKEAAAKTLEPVIERAIARALTQMEDHTGEINGWKGDALASWIVPVVLRAVRRQRKAKP